LPIKLIISDLHLADGHALRDGFCHAQQEALAGLLNAANSAKLLGQAADDVELILNGDCFDFLVIPPLQTHDTTNPSTALEKLEKVIEAHPPFFELLHEFISIPGRSVTFLTGNHDIELCFEAVRARIAEAIDGQTGILRFAHDDKRDGKDERVHFFLTRFYRPLPDVYIEHGNQYDFWNTIRNLWNEQGQPLTHSPDSMTLPVGSQYVLHVGYPISQAYPYFDRFEPSMNILRQIALLSLLDPNLTRETAERLMAMLSYPRKALAHLAPGDEHIPARLFELAMQDFLAFQQDVEARFPARKTHSPTLSPETNRQENSEHAMLEFLTLRYALTMPPLEAIAAICTPVVYSMGEDVARGMQQVLRNNPGLRYAIAGHSHMQRVDTLDNGQQTYLNTGTWTKRIAPPAPGEVTPALVEWLRQPDWSTIPLRDMTQYTFGMIATCENEPSKVELCAWEGGANGNYRVIG
jgi:UDP-2,3-diacylglucosamine pyrophosphatase LpxH